MANQERPRDRGTRVAREQLFKPAHEVRDARIQSGRSQRGVAETAQVDSSWVSHVERAKADGVSVDTMARILAGWGLDLSVRAYPSDEDVRVAGRPACSSASSGGCMSRPVARRFHDSQEAYPRADPEQGQLAQAPVAGEGVDALGLSRIS